MELNEFRSELLDNIHFEASINGTSPREEFFISCADDLVEAEEFEDYEPLAFEGVGSRGRRIQIDGYSYSEIEDCLTIILVPFKDSLEAESLTASDAEVYFRRAIAFVEESLSGFIQKNAEESSPGYGLAVDIQHKYFHVRKIKYYLITDMIMSSRIRDIPSNEINGTVYEYHIWDISRLFALYLSKQGKEDITINLRDFSENGIPCLEAGSNEEYTAYLCSIPGSILASLYNKYGGRLLEGNVRSFLSAKGKINKEIRNTILNKPNMFFAYNNGIAATASEVKVEYGNVCPFITEITSLQIVNGGQTTASLSSAITNDKARANGLKDIYVPMKLSVVSPEKAMELIPNIAKYANKQNKVSDADFFSNHAFHIRMEEFSRRILAPAVMGNQFGTHWYYERARGQFKNEQTRMTKAEKEKFLLQNPKSQMFTKTDLAKFYNIYRQLPNKVSEGAQKNFVAFADWASDCWEKNETELNELFFRKVVCLNILYKKTDAIVKHATWYEMGYKAQVITYTLSYIFHAIEQQYPDLVLDFKTIWNTQNISHGIEIQISQVAEKIYEFLISKDRGIENVTEWAKRVDCWNRAKNLSIPLCKEFVSTLVRKDDEKETQKAEKKKQKMTNEINCQIQVLNYGVEKWKKLLTWGKEQGIFSYQDVSFIQTAIDIERGKIPSEKQSIKILQILEKARLESYPD